ncbi:putative RING finger protein P32A8.03c [Grifola frondosa]|uniref:Putative RING finger protein P32A8.03c n=1 Tax=Grifola frondosa TaxID=5627 RepID=A0A1C7MQP1_GRIFR|nr:putative RING finger protein P32A8.03c [Grifola frondosa]
MSVTIVQVPDPHCASCNGTFVERIETSADDPREFQHGHGAFDDEGLPPDMDAFFASLSTLLRSANRDRPDRSATTSTVPRTGTGSTPGSPPTQGTPGRAQVPPGGHDRPPSGGGGGLTLQIESRGLPGGRTRTFIIGSPPRTGEVPGLSDFASRRTDGGGATTDRGTQGGTITGPLMAQYILSLLSQGPNRGDPFQELFGGTPGAEGGRWGDYVFNQEALDQIITQIMENSNAHAPVPATAEIMEKLPRDVLEEGSPLLEKDCAVCKDQFKLETEDPDEQVIVTLPCHHPFHEPCILPWLKSSGTCPVCRYQLIPQPDTPGSGPPPAATGRPGSPPQPTPSSGSSPPSGGASRGGGGGGGGGGIFNFLSSIAHGHGGSNQSTASASGTSRSSERQRRTYGDEPDQHRFPGGWGDQVD